MSFPFQSLIATDKIWLYSRNKIVSTITSVWLLLICHTYFVIPFEIVFLIISPKQGDKNH